MRSIRLLKSFNGIIMSVYVMLADDTDVTADHNVMGENGKIRRAPNISRENNGRNRSAGYSSYTYMS